MERGKARTGMIGWRKGLEKALPVLYFLFVFFLYFSMLSEPYFTDEQDVFYGAYSVAKGKDIYQSFLSQHMPFSYYFAALVALCGARTVFQFRVGIYVLLSFLWEGIYLRNRKAFHPVTLWSMPLIYLTLLRTLRMGTTMLSDHWQGIGLVLIFLELIRYADTRVITRPCAAMVSLGIVLSLGSSFVSAYSLLCFFLGMAALQAQDYLQARKTDRANGKKYLREDLRLTACCVAPFAMLFGWYALTGNIGNCISGVYEIVTKVYSKYIGGLGSDPVGVVWETVEQYGAYLVSLLRTLLREPWPTLLYLVAAVCLAVCCVLLGRKNPAAGIAAFFAAVYGGMRGFEGFHAMAYYAMASAAAALWAGRAAAWSFRRGKRPAAAASVAAGAAAMVMLAQFIIWAGYNLMYPQVLQDRTLRSEEQILDLLTDSNETVFSCNAPVNSLDVMDLELIPADACGAISYPYFYEMWGDRQMASIQSGQPHVVLYDPDENIWGYVFREYAPDFDAYMKEHYVRLPQAETIWVSDEFAGEAFRRLKEAGYGDRMVSNVTDVTRNHPVEYRMGQSVRAQLIAEGKQLTAIRFCAACFHRRSDPTIRVTVKDPETGNVRAEGVLTGTDIADNYFSRCQMTGTLEAGKTYDVELRVEQIGGKGDMEFYFTPEGELALAAEYAGDP